MIELANGPRVVVVGHRVHFDAKRKLWYCDIELNPGMAYMPFVRLALVRYQPNAISGAKVSRVVISEFAQVLPRRKSVLRREGTGDAKRCQSQGSSSHLNHVALRMDVCHRLLPPIGYDVLISILQYGYGRNGTVL